MVKVIPVEVDGYTFISTEVNLPKTNLLVISTSTGYVMCGALDVLLLREKLASRHILAARAVGVRTMQELLDGEVEDCTQYAESIGISKGMSIREALICMKQSEYPA